MAFGLKKIIKLINHHTRTYTVQTSLELIEFLLVNRKTIYCFEPTVTMHSSGTPRLANSAVSNKLPLCFV